MTQREADEFLASLFERPFTISPDLWELAQKAAASNRPPETPEEIDIWAARLAADVANADD